MSNEKEPQTHVFLKACGCVSGLVVNVPGMFGELARMQRYASKHSETYQLMETQAVREMSWKCNQHKNHGKPLEPQR